MGYKRYNFTVHIAESTGFSLLRVMETTSPVYRNITLAVSKPSCGLHASTSTNTAEVKEAIKNWRISANAVSELLLLVPMHVV